MILDSTDIPARKVKIFTDQQVKELGRQYYSFKRKWINQFYNIHYMERVDVISMKTNYQPYANLIMDAMGGRDKYQLTTYYFLRYLPGSYTTPHRDDGDASTGFTSVTLIDEVNLKGGESLLYERIEKPDFKKYFDDNFKGPKQWEWDDPFRIPVVVQDYKVGDTLIYNQNMKHGVAKVLSGERLVLIAWFKSRGKK